VVKLLNRFDDGLFNNNRISVVYATSGSTTTA
jgi:hypothetical protein